MDIKQKIEDLASRASMALKGDSELFLEAKEELISHLEDKVDHLRHEGLSEEDAWSNAVKCFGSPSEISESLLSANLKRIKLRALSRLVIRYCFFPTSLLCFFWVLSFIFPYGLDKNYTNSSFWAEDLDEYLELSSESSFLIYGDMSRKTIEQQQRAIWEKFPGNKMYFSNYFTHLLAKRENYSLDYLIKECSFGENLEPENARYNLILGYLFLEKAYEGFGTDEEKLIDRKLLDQAVGELKKVMVKTHYNHYGLEVVRERVELFPEVEDLVGRLHRLSYAAGMILPDVSCIRSLTNFLPKYFKLLEQEGKLNEVESLVDFCLHSAKLLHDNSTTLIELLVGRSLINIWKRDYASVYDKIGMEEKRKEMEALVLAVNKEFEMREDDLEKGKSLEDKLKKEAGILVGMLMPAVSEAGGRFVNFDFTWIRWIEFIQGEKVVLGILVFLFLLFSISFYIIGWRWRFSKRLDSIPVMLIPRWPFWIYFIGLCFVLPLFLYYFYSRLTVLSGREYSITYLYHRYILEAVLLISFILFSFWRCIKVYLDHRFLALRINVPKSSKKMNVIIWSLLLVGTAIALMIRDQSEFSQWISTYLASVIFLILFFTSIILFIRFIFVKLDYIQYYTSMARTLAPVFALGLSICAVITIPYLSYHEIRCFQKDEVVGRNGLFFQAEYDMVLDMKKRFKKVIQNHKDSLTEKI